MRDHELELIAALVEGRLDDETEARALIDSAPEYREEFEAQRIAYEALREARPAALTETERAALHRDIWTELRAEPDPASSRTPWYYRWTPVAAGLLVVVGLVAVLNQGGDDSGETMNLAADAPTETSTTAAADSATEEAEDGAAPLQGEATETTTAASDGAMEGAGDDGGDPDLTYSEQAEKVRQGDLSGTALQTYQRDEARSDEIDACFEQLGLGDYGIVATFPDVARTGEEDETTLLVALPGNVETASAPVAFVDPEACELVHFDE